MRKKLVRVVPVLLVLSLLAPRISTADPMGYMAFHMQNEADEPDNYPVSRYSRACSRFFLFAGIVMGGASLIPAFDGNPKINQPARAVIFGSLIVGALSLAFGKQLRSVEFTGLPRGSELWVNGTPFPIVEDELLGGTARGDITSEDRTVDVRLHAPGIGDVSGSIPIDKGHATPVAIPFSKIRSSIPIQSTP